MRMLNVLVQKIIFPVKVIPRLGNETTFTVPSRNMRHPERNP